MDIVFDPDRDACVNVKVTEELSVYIESGGIGRTTITLHGQGEDNEYHVVYDEDNTCWVLKTREQLERR